MQKITVATPGKLIITGEHSVVYGCPALAVPSHLSVVGSLEFTTTPMVQFKTSLFELEVDLKALADLKTKIDNQYQAFLQQKISIDQVLPDQKLLAFYAVAAFASQHDIKTGLKISLQSEIPVGAGMGSSAAIIINILSLLYTAFKIKHSKEQLLTLAKQCENLQHGRSSGLDIAVAGSGRPILYQNATISPFLTAGFRVYIVNTGIPSSSTGDCVDFVKHQFNAQFKDEFANVSDQIINALTNHKLDLLMQGIQENQQLLEKLGVVPQKIIEFRKELITKYSASFKISGAGSIRGEKAGMGLIISKHNPAPLCQEYGYQVWETTI